MASRVRMLSGIFRSAATVKPSCSVVRHVPLLRNVRPIAHPSGFCLRQSSSKSDAAIVDFLQEEIKAETDLAMQQHAETPTVTGFTVTSNEAAVVMEKKYGDEKVLVKFNVNHTVAIQPTDDMMEANQQEEESQEDNIESKPHFNVEIHKGPTCLVFVCQFAEMPFQDDTPDATEMFTIEEIYMHSGEVTEELFAIGGDIVDVNLYNYFLTYLQDRGVDNSFALELIRFSTHYEHAQYVSLLQKISSFIAK